MKATGVLVLVFVVACSVVAATAELDGDRWVVHIDNEVSEQVQSQIKRKVLENIPDKYTGLLQEYKSNSKGFSVHAPEHVLKNIAHPGVTVGRDIMLRSAPIVASEVVEVSRRNAAQMQMGDDGKKIYVQRNVFPGLDRVDQRNPILDELYFYTHYGAGIPIYVLSTGVRADHAEFSTIGGSRVLEGKDVVPRDFTSNRPFDATLNALAPPTAAESHYYPIHDEVGAGTSLASLAAGFTTGAAKGACIIPVRIKNRFNEGYLSWTLAGLDYVKETHKDRFGDIPGIVLLDVNTAQSKILDCAVADLAASGFIPVVPAGDDCEDACDYSPSGVNSAITVGSLSCALSRKNNDLISKSSNFGPCVDIFAQGENLVVASNATNTQYVTSTFSHTSDAAGIAAGVAATIAGYLVEQEMMAEGNQWLKHTKKIMDKIASRGTIETVPMGTKNMVLHSFIKKGDVPHNAHSTAICEFCEHFDGTFSHVSPPAVFPAGMCNGIHIAAPEGSTDKVFGWFACDNNDFELSVHAGNCDGDEMKVVSIAHCQEKFWFVPTADATYYSFKVDNAGGMGRFAMKLQAANYDYSFEGMKLNLGTKIQEDFAPCE